MQLAARLGLIGLFAARPRIEPVPGWSAGTGEYDDTFMNRVRRFIWNRLDRPVTMTWARSLRLSLYPGDEISRALFLTGAFEPTQLAYLAGALKPGMTFIDIGANFGLYTLFASRLVTESGQVISVEPSSREFNHLSENIALNNLQNVTIEKCALADRSGEVELLIANASKSGHNTLGVFGYESVSGEGRERVPAKTLDALVEEHGLQFVHFLKMDIEGSEHLALRGASSVLRRFRPTVLSELSDRTLAGQNCTSADVIRFFLDHDYSVFDFDDITGGLIPARDVAFRDGDNIVALPRERAFLTGRETR